MILDFLFHTLTVAVGLAVALGAVGVFFFFFVLKELAPIGADSRASRVHGVGRHGGTGVRNDAQHAPESANWVNVLLIRFMAVALLGEGSADALVWSNRLCCALDRRVGALSDALAERAGRPGQTTGDSVVALELEQLTLGNALEAPAELPLAGANPGIGLALGRGVALPRVAAPGISSAVRSDGSTLLSIPLEYRDEQLQLVVRGVLPLAVGLGHLGIPADLLTVRTRAALHGLACSLELRVVLRGPIIDLQLPAMPHWEGTFSTTLGRKREVQGGAKMDEIIQLAIRRVVRRIVAPNALRLTLIPESPYICHAFVEGHVPAAGGPSLNATPRE